MTHETVIARETFRLDGRTFTAGGTYVVTPAERAAGGDRFTALSRPGPARRDMTVHPQGIRTT